MIYVIHIMKLYEEVLDNFQNHAKKFESEKGEAA